MRLWLPAQRLEGEEHGLDVFQGNSSTSFAVCLLWTQVREGGAEPIWSLHTVIGFHTLSGYHLLQTIASHA